MDCFRVGILLLIMTTLTAAYSKRVTLTPLNSSVDGAVVNLLVDTIVNGDAWEIMVSNKVGPWAIEVSLDPTWGFSASSPSNITVRVNSDTPTETTTDLELLFSFSVNAAQYWSTELPADNNLNSVRMGPYCDISTPPASTSLLYAGDVKTIVADSTLARVDAAGTQADKWEPSEFQTIYFPVEFKIENHPLDNEMYIYHVQEAYTQKCGFAESFAPGHELQIYLHLDSVDEFLAVQSFEIEYSSDDPTANPTTSPTTQTATQQGKYIVVRLRKTFADAELYCQTEYGTNLASIHNDTDNAVAKSLCKKDEGVSCWIGLTDESQENVFVYTDGTAFDFGSDLDGTYPWSTGSNGLEPNNFGGNEDCIALYHRRNHDWDDMSCTDANYFFCNAPLPTSGPTTDAPTKSPLVLISSTLLDDITTTVASDDPTTTTIADDDDGGGEGEVEDDEVNEDDDADEAVAGRGLSFVESILQYVPIGASALVAVCVCACCVCVFCAWRRKKAARKRAETGISDGNGSAPESEQTQTGGGAPPPPPVPTTASPPPLPAAVVQLVSPPYVPPPRPANQIGLVPPPVPPGPGVQSLHRSKNDNLTLLSVCSVDSEQMYGDGVDEDDELYDALPSQYKEWTSDEVVRWMISLNYAAHQKYEAQLQAAFDADVVNGIALAGVTDEYLADCGVDVVVHRRIILQNIAQLIGHGNGGMRDDDDEAEQQVEGEGKGGTSTGTTTSGYQTKN